MNTSKVRFNMVEQQVRPWQVLDMQVLEALSRLPREQFVAPEWQALAYTDTDLPIGHGEMLLATKIDARLAQDLQLKPTDRVLWEPARASWRPCCRTWRTTWCHWKSSPIWPPRPSSA